MGFFREPAKQYKSVEDINDLITKLREQMQKQEDLLENRSVALNVDVLMAELRRIADLTYRADDFNNLGIQINARLNFYKALGEYNSLIQTNKLTETAGNINFDYSEAAKAAGLTQFDEKSAVRYFNSVSADFSKAIHNSYRDLYINNTDPFLSKSQLQDVEMLTSAVNNARAMVQEPTTQNFLNMKSINDRLIQRGQEKGSQSIFGEPAARGTALLGCTLMIVGAILAPLTFGAGVGLIAAGAVCFLAAIKMSRDARIARETVPVLVNPVVVDDYSKIVDKMLGSKETEKALITSAKDLTTPKAETTTTLYRSIK
jgi:hypothetical protein